MNNGLYLAGIFVYFSIISYISAEIGLTQTKYLNRDVPEFVEPSGGFDALLQVTRYVADVFSSFFQLITFSTAMPPLLNIILIYSPAFAVVWLIATLVRGGAR